ncbi:hypothetical protein B0T25DRAFT_513737 [Lasiosphaeria hispida]|uniref:non-specific serine/threonine protein kinase n=1 Tax=Lasiosphaeria hispida TaxID=260671 RepID=A0AAJ0MKJ8_9PEZI|nr:hypothetical protein B0T25DRAFT_513737 [Lasiosphaeria hispida]
MNQYLQNLTIDLLLALQSFRVSRLLRSSGSGKNLFADLSRLNSAVNSDDFDVDRIQPLLKSAISHDNDVLLWKEVYDTVTETTPPPQPIASYLEQTPWLHNTSSFANSSEYRKDVDRVLRVELGVIYVGIPRFHKTFFGRVAGVETASVAIFKKCMEGSEPLFRNGWSGWPTDANQDHVLSWFAEFNEKLATFTEEYKPTPTHQRRPLAQPNKPIQGSTGERKLDIGFVGDPKAGKDSRCHWSHILVPDGLQFVSTVLGFLWMSEEELGFDPTIMTANNKRFIEIERHGSTERLIIDGVMQRARCIAGRTTTCWKAHHEGHPQTPLVIKDSWEYPERDEEGELLREATGQATNYRPKHSMPPPSMITSGASRRGRSSGSRAAGKKRSSSQVGGAAPLPPSKRSCSASPTEVGGDALSNRVHRRVILRDYGRPIYKASCRTSLLVALTGCIEGHESLHKAGILHRDISINNLLINEDGNNPSWPSLLIDLDLAIKEQREGASGAKRKTGTRAFMAIGALLGEQHSFMHDLESFFWVLFWICIHCEGPDKAGVVQQFDKWNYVDPEELAKLKLGTVAKESIFIKTITDHFTAYCAPLIPLLNKLRKVVFPKDKPWEQEDEKLYFRMRDILRQGGKDLG